MAEVVEWPEEIDLDRAEDAKERAEKRIQEKAQGTDIYRAEAALLRARFSGDNRLELNELIAEYDEELYGLANGEKERYLCLKEDEPYSFQFIGGTRTTKAGDKRSYYVRLVKAYKIESED